MLQLKTKGINYELSSKNQLVVLAGRILNLGEETIKSPGEYEAAGIEVIYGDNAVLIIWENLQIVYAMANLAPTSFEKEQFAGADVLILGNEAGEFNQESLEKLLASYDPRLIVVSPQTQLNDSLKKSLNLGESSTVKLAKANLPEEGQQFLLTD